MGDLPFQTAWIVGASSGIGAELAKRLAGRGVTAVISARSEDKLKFLSDEASSMPGSLIPAPADVADELSLGEAHGAVSDAFEGPPDLVVLSAGFFKPMRAREFSTNLFAQHVDINLMGVARALHLVLPAMIARGHGKIAIVASVSGYRGLPKAAAYGATKAALINLAECLRVELASRGVTVQVVNPGFVDTPLTEQNDFSMPFLMPVDKAADVLLRGLTSSRFEITFPKRFTWQLKMLRLLPYWLYFPLIRRATKQR